MKTIPLTNSEAVVLVSDIDYEHVNQFTWFLKSAKGGFLYAARSYRENGKVKTMWLHRFLAEPEDGEHVHHCDHDKLNCQRDNLRSLDPVTHSRESGIYAATGDTIPF